ncbi:MAG TPA: UvrD-helicase domain-containing protein, partial [Acidimicrobiales bacterium]|nr:UvrD-helicase domain-containing protein [Acidimicrobiales bacterium]
MARGPDRFDPCGPLPGPGVTVLEASAGTGKTFTIAALTTRLVADGVPLAEILAVTFTRMATGELRDRIRARLVSAEDGLGRLLEAGTEPPDADRVLAQLGDGPRAEVDRRRQRLADALATFDAATITTTHGFARLVLAGLGVSGNVATGAVLTEDVRDLVEEVVDDLVVRRVLGWGPVPFDRATALAVATEAVATPDTPVEAGEGDGPSALLGRLARQVRVEVARRLLDANLLTYDDLLVRLNHALADPERGDSACARLRHRYRVVLVDEFQDTDPVQWDVVRRAFGDGRTRLVLIGDPKQAIYAFRGADVYAYLDAARLATHRLTLDENWRSDAALLEASDALLHPLRLGHPDIPYRQVRATPAHRRPGLEGAPVGTALRARILHSGDHDLPITPTKRLVRKSAAVEWVAADLADDAVALLGSGAQVVTREPDQAERSRHTLGPGDLAVLVRTNPQARVVQEALRAAGVPAVVAGTDSVFSTPAAGHWRRLLEALEQPASRPKAVAVALTPFVGMDAAAVAGAGDTTWEGLHARLHRWADLLRHRGVASLFRAIAADTDLPARMLGGHDGERELTDLGHVAELLHAEGADAQLGPPALRAWLAHRIDEAGVDNTEARSRRLDSDADAVQVLTVHRAKGLEFPVVYCPYLWDPGPSARTASPVVFHDPVDGYRRKLDVGGPDQTPAYRRHARAHHEEQRGEDLRLLYVALTRARHQAVVWWARVSGCHHSPLGRLLTVRDGEGNVAPDGSFVPGDEDVHRRLAELAGRAPEQIAVERCGPRRDIRWEPPGAVPGDELAAASLERLPDPGWRRRSYTSLTAPRQDEAVDSEPEERGTADEPGPAPGGAPAGAGGTTDAADDGTSLSDVPTPWAEAPGGREVGTFVHRVLEQVDFTVADLAGDLARVVMAERPRHAVGPEAADAVVAGLAAALATPLGPLVDGARLRDVPPPDRLDELGFELPLVGGDRPSAALSAEALARLIDHHLGSGARLAGYGARLAEVLAGTDLRGYLTGSL